MIDNCQEENVSTDHLVSPFFFFFVLTVVFMLIVFIFLCFAVTNQKLRFMHLITGSYHIEKTNKALTQFSSVSHFYTPRGYRNVTLD